MTKKRAIRATYLSALKEITKYPEDALYGWHTLEGVKDEIFKNKKLVQILLDAYFENYESALNTKINSIYGYRLFIGALLDYYGNNNLTLNSDASIDTPEKFVIYTILNKKESDYIDDHPMFTQLYKLNLHHGLIFETYKKCFKKESISRLEQIREDYYIFSSSRQKLNSFKLFDELSINLGAKDKKNVNDIIISIFGDFEKEPCLEYLERTMSEDDIDKYGSYIFNEILVNTDVKNMAQKYPRLITPFLPTSLKSIKNECDIDFETLLKWREIIPFDYKELKEIGLELYSKDQYYELIVDQLFLYIYDVNEHDIEHLREAILNLDLNTSLLEKYIELVEKLDDPSTEYENDFYFYAVLSIIDKNLNVGYNGTDIVENFMSYILNQKTDINKFEIIEFKEILEAYKPERYKEYMSIKNAMESLGLDTNILSQLNQQKVEILTSISSAIFESDL